MYSGKIMIHYGFTLFCHSPPYFMNAIQILDSDSLLPLLGLCYELPRRSKIGWLTTSPLLDVTATLLVSVVVCSPLQTIYLQEYLFV